MRSALFLVAGLIACYPTTTRPDLTPLPEAIEIEIELPVPEATRAVALALDTDSIPIRRTEPLDGWLETDWFDATTLLAVRGRPLGDDAVKVRAFVDPGRPNHSMVSIEVVQRIRADPALPPRELEVQLPGGHPVMRRVLRAVARLTGAASPPDSTKATPGQQPGK